MAYRHGTAAAATQPGASADLETRVRAEAEAAARAPSLEATLFHLDLAAAYAAPIRGERNPGNRADRAAADSIRVW